MARQRKVATYVRVSTQEQAKDGASLQAQREYLRLWAERESWTITTEYADEGRSGKDIGHRPELRKALADARGGPWDALLVYHNDRLSRDTEDALNIARTLKKAGRSLLCGNLSVDIGTPEGALLFTMMAGFAEYFRKDLGRKTSLGMRKKRDQGIWMGRASRFFRIGDDGRLVAVDPKVGKALELRARGRTYAEIARAVRLPVMTTWRMLRAAEVSGIGSEQG